MSGDKWVKKLAKEKFHLNAFLVAFGFAIFGAYAALSVTSWMGSGPVAKGWPLVIMSVLSIAVIFSTLVPSARRATKIFEAAVDGKLEELFEGGQDDEE